MGCNNGGFKGCLASPRGDRPSLLYYAILYNTILYYIVLQYTIDLNRTIVLYCTILYTILHSRALTFGPSMEAQLWPERKKSKVFSFRKPGNHPNFEKKSSRSEKAILGATLGIPGYSRSTSRNGTHDLFYVKTLFSEQLSQRLSELVGRQNFSPNSRSVVFKIGVVPARQTSFSLRNLSFASAPIC